MLARLAVTDFIITNRDLNNVVQVLTEGVPSFAQSEELRLLGDGSETIPGLVCGAFARFLCRLHETASKDDSADHHLEFDRCYAMIEWMASSRDAEVRNLLVTEIYELLADHATILGEVRARLRPASDALYRQWIVN